MGEIGDIGLGHLDNNLDRINIHKLRHRCAGLHVLAFLHGHLVENPVDGGDNVRAVELRLGEGHPRLADLHARQGLVGLLLRGRSALGQGLEALVFPCVELSLRFGAQIFGFQKVRVQGDELVALVALLALSAGDGRDAAGHLR